MQDVIESSTKFLASFSGVPVTWQPAVSATISMTPSSIKKIEWLYPFDVLWQKYSSSGLSTTPCMRNWELQTVLRASSSNTASAVKRRIVTVSSSVAFSIYPTIQYLSCGLLQHIMPSMSENNNAGFSSEVGIVYKEQVTGQECSVTCSCIAIYQCQLADVVAADRLVLKYALDSLGKTGSNRELLYLWTTLCVRDAVCEHNLSHLRLAYALRCVT